MFRSYSGWLDMQCDIFFSRKIDFTSDRKEEKMQYGALTL